MSITDLPPNSLIWQTPGLPLLRDPIILTREWRDWAITHWQSRLAVWTTQVGPLSRETVKLIDREDYFLTFALWLALIVGDKELGEARTKTT